MGSALRQQSPSFYDSAQRQSLLVGELRELAEYRYLLAQFISRNIKTRYKRSVLGIAWTMLNPLLSMAVLWFVFSNIFVTSVSNYAVYILSGLLVWTFFSQSTVAVMTEVVWGSSLLTRIYLPRSIFAFSALGTALVNFVLALIPMAIIMAFSGAHFSWALLFLPVAMVIIALFALGIGLWLSTLAIQFADVVDMYQILLTAWMYLTPIIYPLEIVPKENRWLFNLNPIYHMIELFREPILHGALPAPQTVLISTLLALVVCVTGLLFFLRHADEIAYRI